MNTQPENARAVSDRIRQFLARSPQPAVMRRRGEFRPNDWLILRGTGRMLSAVISPLLIPSMFIAEMQESRIRRAERKNRPEAQRTGDEPLNFANFPEMPPDMEAALRIRKPSTAERAGVALRYFFEGRHFRASEHVAFASCEKYDAYYAKGRKEWQNYLARSPEIAEMRRAWGEAGDEERLEMVRRLQARHCAALDIQPAKIGLMSIPPVGLGTTLGHATTQGVGFPARDEDLMIEFNTGLLSGWHDFDLVTSLLAHENTHILQYQNISRAMRGEIGADDPRHAQCFVLLVGCAAKGGNWNYFAYRARPQEMEAFAVGGATSRALAANRWRFSPIGRLFVKPGAPGQEARNDL
jgi:hypothetical protein